MAPPDHNGPFVNDSRGPGLLRRLFGGGSHDPTAPHAHHEPSTSEMHDRVPRRTSNPTPVAPSSPFGTQRTERRGEGAPTPARERGIVASILMWIVRRMGIRLAIALAAGILVLIGSFNDGSSEIDQASRDLQEIQDRFAGGTFSAQDPTATEPTTPAPSAAPRGSYRVTVDKADLEYATLTDARGTTYVWNVDDPTVSGALALNAGEQVLVYWEDRGGEIFVVGVEGPNGSDEPPVGT